MNNRIFLIAVVIFFLIVNTSSYWITAIGLFGMYVFLFLAGAYVCFIIWLLFQTYLAAKEKFSNKRRLVIISLVTIMLALVLYKPDGFINSGKPQSDVLLMAQREGAANCTTTLMLYNDFTYTERNVCFGVTETSGSFHLQNDTIYFDKVKLGHDEKEYFQYAVIRPSGFFKDEKHVDIVRYKSKTDTAGYELWIAKNELYKLKDKQANNQ